MGFGIKALLAAISAAVVAVAAVLFIIGSGEEALGPTLPGSSTTEAAGGVELTMTDAESERCAELGAAFWHPVQEASDPEQGWAAALEWREDADITLDEVIWLLDPGVARVGARADATAVAVPRSFSTAQEMVDLLFAGPTSGEDLIFVDSGFTGATACLWSVWHWTYLYVYLEGDCFPAGPLSPLRGVTIADHFAPLVDPGRSRQVVLFAPDGSTDSELLETGDHWSSYMRAALRTPDCLEIPVRIPEDYHPTPTLPPSPGGGSDLGSTTTTAASTTTKAAPTTTATTAASTTTKAAPTTTATTSVSGGGGGTTSSVPPPTFPPSG